MTDYNSFFETASEVMPGVSYRIRRISFSRRLALSQQLRDLSRELEFRSASEDVKEQLDASVLTLRMEELYLRQGLVAVCGLRIDGEDASPEAVIERGPEKLVREMVAAIRKEFGLSDDERKN